MINFLDWGFLGFDEWAHFLRNFYLQITSVSKFLYLRNERFVGPIGFLRINIGYLCNPVSLEFRKLLEWYRNQVRSKVMFKRVHLNYQKIKRKLELLLSLIENLSGLLKGVQKYVVSL
jgi:hypothetical protein